MQLPDYLPSGVTEPLYRMISEIGQDFSVNDIIGYIERHRRKPLRIEYDDMPVTMTGYVIALRDCDLICIGHNLSATQKLVTQLHEMGHIIRGDIPMLSLGEDTDVYMQFSQRINRYTISSGQRKRFLDMYSTSQERETELLARTLLRFIRQNEQNMPQVAQQLFNWV